MLNGPGGSRHPIPACLVAAWLLAASPLVTRAAAGQAQPETARRAAAARLEPQALAATHVLVIAPPEPAAREAATRPRAALLRRPTVLPSLYVAFAGLQVLDADSTLNAPRNTREVNPLMDALQRHPGAMYSVKAGVTAATIYASERLWKRKRRGAAIAFMVAANCAWVAVVANNYSRQR